MDLGELYAGPWQDFIARRDRLVAAAKAAGDRPAAQALKALRKPTRAAWLVDLLARHEPTGLAEVLALGDSLAQAHRAADPAELRRLSALQRAVVDSLATRASGLGGERGYAAPDSVRQEVAETLQAALTDPELAERVRTGTLSAAVRAAGFGPADAMFSESPLGKVIPLPSAPPGSSSEGPDPLVARRLSRELGHAEARWEEAEKRLQRAREATASTEKELQEEEVRLALLVSRADELRTALQAAEKSVRAARESYQLLGKSLAVKRSAQQRDADESRRLHEEIDRLNNALGDLGNT